MQGTTFTRSLSALALLACGAILLAGDLNPPAGPVAPTMKTLDEIEARTPINLTNTPGDADSLYKITAPGSYYLTGNITGVVGKHGIEIAAAGVTLDLNGFDLAGVAGSLAGVFASSGSDDVAVRNGSIRNWGDSGVNLFTFSAERSEFDGLRVTGNGSVGIAADNAARIRDCVVSNNGGSGITTSQGAVITGVASFQNGNTGISAGSGSLVAHCAAYLNEGYGISVASGGTVVECIARGNSTYGIGTSSNCQVIDCQASANTLDGIRCAGTGSMIRGNACTLNGLNAGDGAGIVVVSNDNTIEGNVCTDNDRGIHVTGLNNLILKNSCADNTTHYQIVAGNRYGAIVNITAGGAAAVTGSAAASTLLTTDPWANFSY
ncbi:MAG: right-handed parallel beta-helix repeat-containing protein [Phycisphaerales bacterium]|nr:right-handed parallel beta-helix repeat-containing protein [Phycisphaerales bacterium]